MAKKTLATIMAVLWGLMMIGCGNRVTQEETLVEKDTSEEHIVVGLSLIHI